MGGGPTWDDYRRDFVDATAAIAGICRDMGVRRFVYASSSAALFLGRKERQDESAGPDPLPEQRSFYTRGKVLAERRLMEMHRRDGFPVVIVRPCLVVGRGGFRCHPGMGVWVNELFCLGWGDGRNALPFVLVEDVAQALHAVKDAEAIEGRSFNLAGDVRPSARDYVRELAARTMRNYRFRPRNLRLLYAAGLAKTAAKKPSFRDFASRGLFADLDCTAAKTALGWKPETDPAAFFREAIDANTPPIIPGDIRLERRTA
jgi:nucleoside-diphosphate-sugar epimerase